MAKGDIKDIRPGDTLTFAAQDPDSELWKGVYFLYSGLVIAWTLKNLCPAVMVSYHPGSTKVFHIDRMDVQEIVYGPQ